MYRFALIALLAWAVGPARGQDAHGEDVEVIAAPAVPDKNPPPDLGKVGEAILERTNALRKPAGAVALKANDKLQAAAQSFAAYMAKEDRYGHTADGTRPADRVAKEKYEYCLVLENIAYAFSTEGFTKEKLADKFMTGWENSPGHKKNMLDPDVTELGTAVARSEKTGYYYAVQVFGRPKADAITFKIENTAAEAVEYTLGDKAYTLEPRYTRTHAVCRPPTVAFRWPGTKPDAPGEEHKPTTGQKLTVAKAGDKWSVTTK
jgi:uncharacterized protein YkwD